MDPNTPPATWATVDPTAFRRSMRHIPTPVAIVTTTVGTTPVGLTVGSFASVSLVPALRHVLRRQAVDHLAPNARFRHLRDQLSRSRDGQRCRSFSGKGADRFAGIPWNPSEDGDPILTEASVVFECTKHSTRCLGDHIQVVGEVQRLHLLREELPLVYHRGAFLNLDHLHSA